MFLPVFTLISFCVFKELAARTTETRCVRKVTGLDQLSDTEKGVIEKVINIQLSSLEQIYEYCDEPNPCYNLELHIRQGVTVGARGCLQRIHAAVHHGNSRRRNSNGDTINKLVHEGSFTQLTLANLTSDPVPDVSNNWTMFIATCKQYKCQTEIEFKEQQKAMQRKSHVTKSVAIGVPVFFVIIIPVILCCISYCRSKHQKPVNQFEIEDLEAEPQSPSTIRRS